MIPNVQQREQNLVGKTWLGHTLSYNWIYTENTNKQTNKNKKRKSGVRAYDIKNSGVRDYRD